MADALPKGIKMYLHLGSDTVVKINDIIGIFDIDKTTVSKITKEFLNSRNKDYEVFYVSPELPKSFILCSEKGKNKLYISQLAPQTLRKRLESLYISEVYSGKQ